MRLVSVADALATNSIYSSLHRATGRTAHPFCDVPHLCGAPSRISFKFELQQLPPLAPCPSSLVTPLLW